MQVNDGIATDPEPECEQVVRVRLRTTLAADPQQVAEAVQCAIANALFDNQMEEGITCFSGVEIG